ncbi:MAG: hypothetical protein ACYC5V_02170 [Gemmatimonadaceae bacterium]
MAQTHPRLAALLRASVIAATSAGLTAAAIVGPRTYAAYAPHSVAPIARPTVVAPRQNTRPLRAIVPLAVAEEEPDAVVLDSTTNPEVAPEVAPDVALEAVAASSMVPDTLNRVSTDAVKPRPNPSVESARVTRPVARIPVRHLDGAATDPVRTTEQGIQNAHDIVSGMANTADRIAWEKQKLESDRQHLKALKKHPATALIYFAERWSASRAAAKRRAQLNAAANLDQGASMASISPGVSR